MIRQNLYEQLMRECFPALFPKCHCMYCNEVLVEADKATYRHALNDSIDCPGATTTAFPASDFQRVATSDHDCPSVQEPIQHRSAEAVLADPVRDNAFGTLLALSKLIDKATAVLRFGNSGYKARDVRIRAELDKAIDEAEVAVRRASGKDGR